MLCIPISVPYTQPFYWCINLTGTKCFIHLPKVHHQVTHSYAEIQKWEITDYSTIVILIQNRAITNSSVFLVQNREITYYYWISHTKLGNHWLLYHCISHTKHSNHWFLCISHTKQSNHWLLLDFSYKTGQSVFPLLLYISIWMYNLMVFGRNMSM